MIVIFVAQVPKHECSSASKRAHQDCVRQEAERTASGKQIVCGEHFPWQHHHQGSVPLSVRIGRGATRKYRRFRGPCDGVFYCEFCNRCYMNLILMYIFYSIKGCKQPSEK